LKGEYENKFIDQNNIFLIGSVSMDLTGKTEMEELMKAISRAYPTEPDGSVTTMSVQARAFATKAKKGDWVVVPSMDDEKLLNIGEITGDYNYDKTKSELKHSHTVDWKYGAWKRDQFDEEIIRSVDAFDTFMMFFKLRQEKRIKEIVLGGVPFAKTKPLVKKSVNKPEPEPIVESEPVFANNEVTELIAEVRETITQVRKSNFSEAADVKKMIAEIADVIDEIRSTITEVKKATLTEAAEIKKVISEVRDAIDEATDESVKVKKLIADFREAINEAADEAAHEAAEVKKVIIEVRNAIKATADEDAEVKKVIAEVRNAVKEAESHHCCCNGHDHDNGYADNNREIVYRFNEWYCESLRTRRRFRR
jgi:predicted Mrr-cat superfamily restriction endonuclease